MPMLIRRPFLAGIGALAIVASTVLTAEAACYPSGQELPAQDVSSFLGSPASLLQANPNGGAGLISRIRDLAASSPDTLQPLINLLQNANAEQRAAIGTGLGQAATICVRTDQAFATRIQQAVAASGAQEAILAYASTTGGTQTAAVGGGGGGGGGGPTQPGLGPSGAGGAAFAIGSFSTPTLGPPPNQFGTGGGLIPDFLTSSSTIITITTITNTVSP
jgi:hypothetical protein